MKRLFIEQLKGWRPQEAAWLAFSVSAITSLSVYWGDGTPGIIAATTGMVYTVLAGKGKPSCFLFGLVNTPIYAYLAFSSGYYGDFSLNVFYFIMMFAGLASWLKNTSSDPEEGVKRTRLSLKGRFILTFLCIAAVLPLWGVLSVFDGSRPFCDSVTNVLSVAAMILTIRRAIEEWILWIAVNAVEVFMWYRVWTEGSGHVSILLMWLLFLVNGIYLFSLWMRIERKSAKSPYLNGDSSTGNQVR